MHPRHDASHPRRVGGAGDAGRSTASPDHIKDRSRHLLLAIINGLVSFLTLAALERIQILKLELRDITDSPHSVAFIDLHRCHVLEETEHFGRWRQKQIAKIV